MRLACALAVAAGLVGNVAYADVLTLVCPGLKEPYMIKFDTEKRVFTRHVGGVQQVYRVVRSQIEGPDVLVWAVSRELSGDLLAFFGAQTMVKHFYGNGSETTDACRQI